MQAKRYQEILNAVSQTDWQQVLELLHAQFNIAHPQVEGITRIRCVLNFNWGYRLPENTQDCFAPEETEDILPFLQSLPDEAVYCMMSVRLNPEIDFGEEHPFMVEAKSETVGSGIYQQAICYHGDITPHWQQLRLRIADKETIMNRTQLYSGCTVAETPHGQLKAYAVSDGCLTLMTADGSVAVELTENREFFHLIDNGVEAMVEYDHDEYPALWSWFHLDDYTEGGDNPWYTRHHDEKKDLKVGRNCIPYADDGSQVPQVTILKIEDRSLTVRVKGKNVNKKVVLDKPNHTEIIWQRGKKSLKACLYVTDPHNDKAWFYFGQQTPPVGCRVQCTLNHQGEEITSQNDVRSLYCHLRPEEGSGGWNWPCVWGFVNGKMILGKDSPSANSELLGLLPEGELGTYDTDDNNSFKDDDDIINNAKVSVVWKRVEMDFEVTDGELKSVPDAKEITIPKGVTKIYYEALLTAPSLERIIIPADVVQFSYALETYHKERHRKLDVVYEGTLQDWFDHASNLSGHIGKLVIEGKEQDFYTQRHLVIPEGITRIGNGLFQENMTLESVVLGPQVVAIGDSAFRYCDSLRKVEVLGPAEIGPSAFCSCDTLEEVYLADGVTALYDGCFDFVTTLKKLYIPESVKVAQCLSSQNDGSGHAPIFYCAAKSKPDGWWDTWNLAYYDPRFGLGHGHDYYHLVIWGAQRTTFLPS
jgi:hypothetical protein